MSKSQAWSPKAAELYFKDSIIGQLSAIIGEAVARRSTAAEDARKAAALAARRSPTATARTAAPAAAPATPAAPVEARMSLLDRLDAWHFRQAQREREAYLAGSKDVFELERRIRAIDRGAMSRYF